MEFYGKIQKIFFSDLFYKIINNIVIWFLNKTNADYIDLLLDNINHSKIQFSCYYYINGNQNFIQFEWTWDEFVKDFKLQEVI